MPEYEILERFLDDTILGTKVPLKAKILVIHATANPGATDENHFSWLNQTRRHGWAHYYLDWDSISQMVPEGFVAPAQGPTKNAQAISIEICEPPTNVPWVEQVHMFTEAWNRAVWLSANICRRKGWSSGALWNHNQVSQAHPNETDHTDPIAFFKRFGKTWENFVQDVALKLREMAEFPAAEPWKHEFIDKLLTTGIISQARHPDQPVLWWELAAVTVRILEKIEQLIEKALGRR